MFVKYVILQYANFFLPVTTVNVRPIVIAVVGCQGKMSESDSDSLNLEQITVPNSFQTAEDARQFGIEREERQRPDTSSESSFIQEEVGADGEVNQDGNEQEQPLEAFLDEQLQELETEAKELKQLNEEAVRESLVRVCFN